MSEINMDLNDRTKRMVSNLATVSQNIQLVEAEVYNSLSERMIADQGPQAKRGLASDSAKKAPKRDDGPTWDWGKFSMTASEDDEAEFWEDELGFLKANVIDQCTS